MSEAPKTPIQLPTEVEMMVQDFSEACEGKDAGHVLHALGELAGRVLHGLGHLTDEQRMLLCRGLAARAFKTSKETTSGLRCVRPGWLK